MKSSTLLACALAAATSASAYSIDLWSEYDYQGTQAKFVSLAMIIHSPVNGGLTDTHGKDYRRYSQSLLDRRRGVLDLEIGLG
jgi:hypothetical protein